MFSRPLYKKAHYLWGTADLPPSHWVCGTLDSPIRDVPVFDELEKSFLFVLYLCTFGSIFNQIEHAKFLPELLFPFSDISLLFPSSLWFLGVGESSVNCRPLSKGVMVYMWAAVLDPWRPLAMCLLSFAATGQPTGTCSPPARSKLSSLLPGF